MQNFIRLVYLMHIYVFSEHPSYIEEESKEFEHLQFYCLKLNGIHGILVMSSWNIYLNVRQWIFVLEFSDFVSLSYKNEKSVRFSCKY